MTKKQKQKAKRKAKREEARLAAAVAEDPKADEKAEELTELEAQDELEKSLDEEKVYMSFEGITSWEEFFAAREAAKISDAIFDVENAFFRMLNSIRRNEMLSASEKISKYQAAITGYAGASQQVIEEAMTKEGGEESEEPIDIVAALELDELEEQEESEGLGDKIKGMFERIKETVMPKPQNTSGFIVQKDLHGDWRWIGWVSNQFKDRENDIIAEEAHKDFIDWVYEDTKERMPELWVYHIAGTETEHPADFAGYTNGFVIMSGKLTEDEATRMKALGEKYDLAMSHGFWGWKEDEESNIFKRYRTFEATVLPRDKAANEWTNFETIMEVGKMFENPEQREFLVDALGEAKVEALEGSAKDISEALKAAGVEHKENDQPADEGPGTGEALPDMAAIVEAVGKELGFSELSAFIADQQKAIEELTAEKAEMKDQISELTKSEDEKVAEALTPKAQVPIWLMGSAAESDETIVKEDDVPDPPQDPGAPKGSWVSDAMGQTPVDSGAQVPLS